MEWKCQGWRETDGKKWKVLEVDEELGGVVEVDEEWRWNRGVYEDEGEMMGDGEEKQGVSEEDEVKGGGGSDERLEVDLRTSPYS